MSLEEKKIVNLLRSLSSAELLFVNLTKAVLALDGAGANGPRSRGCFEVDLVLDHDQLVVSSATVRGVTPFKPGYVKLDGRHDLDGGNLFSTIQNGWMTWCQADGELVKAEIYSAEYHEMFVEKLRQE